MSRTPPHSLEMEEATLGSMLLSPSAVDVGLDLLSPDDFHKPRHASLFSAISRLAQAGTAINPELVAVALGWDANELRTLAGNAPASMNAKHYAGVVAECGALRRTIKLAGALADAAYEKDTASIDVMLSDPMATVMPNYEAVGEPIEASELASEEYAPDFVLPGLLARQEIVMWVGEPGWGKSTLLRQMAVRAASAQHPFTGVPIKPIRVLMIDCQESRGQAGLEIRKLLHVARDQYRGTLWIEPLPQGIDLTTRRHQRWLDAKVSKVDADLVVLGPLYNLVRGDPSRAKHSEETAELGMNALTDLMVRRDVALMIEAHAPHGSEMRVRGSKLWEDFPDFGFGLVPDESHRGGRAVDVQRFRGDRHYRPAWPHRYVQGLPGEWPWVAIDERRPA